MDVDGAALLVTGTISDSGWNWELFLDWPASSALKCSRGFPAESALNSRTVNVRSAGDGIIALCRRDRNTLIIFLFYICKHYIKDIMIKACRIRLDWRSISSVILVVLYSSGQNLYFYLTESAKYFFNKLGKSVCMRKIKNDAAAMHLGPWE